MPDFTFSILRESMFFAIGSPRDGFFISQLRSAMFFGGHAGSPRSS